MNNQINIEKLPGFLLRRGRWMIFITLLFLAAILLGIRTNEIIKGEVILQNGQEVVQLNARAEGILSTHFQDGEFAKRGDLLGIIQKDYDPRILLELRNQIDTIQRASLTVPLIKSLCLEFGHKDIGAVAEGLLQNLDFDIQQYQHSQSTGQQFVNELEIVRDDKILLLENEISSIYEADHVLRAQYSIDSAALARLQLLLTDGSISVEEYENQKKIVNDNILTRTRNKKEIESIQKQIHEQREQVMKEEKNLAENMQVEYLSILEQLSALKEHCSTEIYERFVYAPIEGIIGLPKFRHQFFVNPDDLIFIIAPETNDLPKGYITISQQGAAKIQSGDEVRIKLDAYPYLEYGALIGKVQHLSQMTEEANYQAVIHFPNGMVTNYDKQIDYLPEMVGQSEIIIRKENLFENILRILKWNQKLLSES